MNCVAYRFSQLSVDKSLHLVNNPCKNVSNCVYEVLANMIAREKVHLFYNVALS